MSKEKLVIHFDRKNYVAIYANGTIDSFFTPNASNVALPCTTKYDDEEIKYLGIDGHARFHLSPNKPYVLEIQRDDPDNWQFQFLQRVPSSCAAGETDILIGETRTIPHDTLPNWFIKKLNPMNPIAGQGNNLANGRGSK